MPSPSRSGPPPPVVAEGRGSSIVQPLDPTPLLTPSCVFRTFPSSPGLGLVALCGS